MKKGCIFFFILLIFCSINANGQALDDPKPDPMAEVLAQLSDSLSGTSSLFFWQDRLWTLNDHDIVKFFAIDTMTGEVDTVLDTGLEIVDMEEVAQDDEYFYLGDFGNNGSTPRRQLNVYRMSKANLLSGNYVVDTTSFTYPGYDPDSVDEGGYLPSTDFDCEAMVASGNYLFLFTKQWSSMQTECYMLPKQPGTYTLLSLGSFDVEGLVTGAWLHPEQSLLVLCGYSLVCQPFVHLFYNYSDNDFFGGENLKVHLANGLGTQTEAIYSHDGEQYLLTNEKFDRLGTHRPAQLLQLDLSDYRGSSAGTNSHHTHGINRVLPPAPKVFPNPTGDELTVVVAPEVAGWSDVCLVLYNLSGQEVLRRPTHAEQMHLSLQEVPAGKYLLSVVSSGAATASAAVVRQ